MSIICLLLANTIMSVRNRGRSKEDGVVETIAEVKDKVKNSMRSLYYYHELDEWQQDNHFIRSGYVKETGLIKECVALLFYVHNETGNIYSHLVPSLGIMGLLLWYINGPLEQYDNSLGIWEKVNIAQFGLAATFCMFMSSTFHCIKSHSHTVSKMGNQLDYFGIIILITCSLVSIILFAFYDHPVVKYTFCVIFGILGSICTVLTLDPKFLSNVYRPFRLKMFILFGLSGVLPVLTAAYMFGYSNAVERANAVWLVLEGVFYITGAVLYAARFPERLTHKDENEVGHFDIWGHSHQIFHVLVVIAAWCHWKALIGSYHYLHRVTLPQMSL